MTRLAFIVFAASLSSAALAAPSADGNREVRYNEKTILEFDALDILGTNYKPPIEVVNERKPATFPPMIRPRRSFDPEMRESIDTIK